MSAGLTGMLLGLVAAVGLVLAVSYAPPFRSVRLVDRLAPYVHDTPPPSRLLGTATEPGLLTAAHRVFDPPGSSPVMGLLAGFVVGLLVADASGENRDLQERLEVAEAQVAEYEESRDIHARRVSMLAQELA